MIAVWQNNLAMAEVPFRDSHRIGGDFLLTDLDVALTFLGVAAHSRREETARRCREKALRALVTVLRLRKRLVLDDAQAAAFDEKVALVKTQLQSAGIPVPNADCAPANPHQG